jgi:hypothetical protein
MAAMALFLLLEQKELIVKAHTPEETQETNRQRWEKILNGFNVGGPDSTNRHAYTGNAGTYRIPDYTFSQNTSDTFTAPRAEAPKETSIAMPFEIYPAGMQPNETERAGATRANSLMREQLEHQGWTGGTPTEAQVKKATQGVLRSLHPDTNPNLSAADQEAGKLISGQMRDITKDLYGEKVGAPTPPAGHSTETQPAPAEHQPEPTPSAPTEKNDTPASHSESGPAALEG